MAMDQLYTDTLKELEQARAARDEYRNHLEVICEMTGEGSDIGAAHEAVNALIEQRDQYRAAEAYQIALREKMEQERDALAAHVERLNLLAKDAYSPKNGWTIQDLQELGRAALQDTPATSLARRDAKVAYDAVYTATVILNSVEASEYLVKLRQQAAATYFPERSFPKVLLPNGTVADVVYQGDWELCVRESDGSLSVVHIDMVKQARGHQ